VTGFLKRSEMGDLHCALVPLTKQKRFHADVDDVIRRCWYGYTKEPYYWIVEGPRVVIIGVRIITSTYFISTSSSLFDQRLQFSILHLTACNATHLDSFIVFLHARQRYLSLFLCGFVYLLSCLFDFTRESF